MGFPCGSVVKNLPAGASGDTRAQSLGQENALEEEMATHSSILAWEIPWTEESGGLQSMGMQRIRMTELSDWAHIHQKECLHLKFASLSENQITKGVNKHWPNSYLLQSIRILIPLNTSSSQPFYYKKSYMEIFKTHCGFFRNLQ